MIDLISSTIVEDLPQLDKRRAIRERHLFSPDIERTIDYLAEPDEDVEARLQANGTRLLAELRHQAAEIERIQRLERDRATALLALPDDAIKSILMLDSDDALQAEIANLRIIAGIAS